MDEALAAGSLKLRRNIGSMLERYEREAPMRGSNEARFVFPFLIDPHRFL
jgi:hypothetical protein